MNQCEVFSINTNRYLSDFENILHNMIRGMESARLNGSISHNFIVQMIPHHMAAIKMSQNLLCYTTFIPLQEIASNIIISQTESIHNMQHILHNCSRFSNSRQEWSCYQENINCIIQNMIHAMKDACPDNDINISFMREMIPHHMGAIQMSHTALEYPICPALVPILDAIIKSQEKGVQEMKCLLSELESPCETDNCSNTVH